MGPMKKLLLVLCLFMLSACGNKYYVISVGEEKITVGKDTTIPTNENINYKTYTDKKGNEVLSEISFLVDDVDSEIKINDVSINDSVKSLCDSFNGEYSYKLNETCLIHKTVSNRENYIIISGNILNDNVDKIDNITVGYDY